MNVRSNSKKQRILNATMELIGENGLHNTPMSQVIKRSGVSAGAIYNYFGSKDEIINQLYLDMKAELITAALKDYKIDISYRDRFFLIWKNLFYYLVSNSRKLSFIEQCSTSPLISDDARVEGKKMLAPICGFVMEGIESGILKSLDLDLIFSLIYGTIISAAKLHLSGTLEINSSNIPAAIECCWDGVKNRE